MSRMHERRAEGRVPVAMPAWLSGGAPGATAHGMARDASESGVLIALRDHPPGLGGEGLAEIAFPSGRRRLRVREIRREAAPDGQLLVALRLLDHPCGAGAAGEDRPARPAWPACAARRPRAVVRADLRALGAAAYDLAVRGPATGVPEDLAAWAADIAGELGARCEPAGSAESLVASVRALWDLA